MQEKEMQLFGPSGPNPNGIRQRRGVPDPREDAAPRIQIWSEVSSRLAASSYP